MYFKPNQELRQDNVFVNAEIRDLQELTGMPVTQGKRKAVISEGEIVNLVSSKYGFLPNESFYTSVEEKLINLDIPYLTRSINNNNKSFKVDYLLINEQVKTIGTSFDQIIPMLSFVNSYDGSSKTQGTFAIYRKVCSNGLHIAQSEMKFSFKHWDCYNKIIMPEIDKLIEKFTSTEYYKLEHKFNKLSNAKISDVQEFVQNICNKTKIFQYEISEKNPDPSKRASKVIDTIYKESSHLSVSPNMWLGYNAFNEIIDNAYSNNFQMRNIKDSQMFETILELA